MIIPVGGMTKWDGLEGDVANFRLWDHELDHTQINALTCLDEGNVMSQKYMNYTFVNSTTQKPDRDFPCGKSDNNPSLISIDLFIQKI